MLILSDSRKPERAMSDFQGQLFFAGAASLSVKFCETLSKLCLKCSFTSASEKMFCAIAQYVVRKVYFSAQPNNLKLILNFQKYYPI